MAADGTDSRPRLLTSSRLALLVSALLLALLTSGGSGEEAEVVGTREEMTVMCLPRKYTFTVVKNLQQDGDLLLCNETVTVTSCYGRCESNEIPDYEVPYKISHHPVCTYGHRAHRQVRLTNCDRRHPDPFALIPEAETCSCLVCDSYDTNCETLT